MSILDDLTTRFNSFVSGVKQNFDLGKIGPEAVDVLRSIAPKLTPATDLASRFAQYLGPDPYSQVPQFKVPKVNIPNMPNVNWDDLTTRFQNYVGGAAKQMVDENQWARQYGITMPSMAAPTLAQSLTTAYKPQLERFKPFGLPVGKAVEGVANFLGTPEDVQAIYKKFQAGQKLTLQEADTLKNHETMTMMGMVTPGASALKEQATAKLGGLMHYGEDLLRRGFTKSQVDAIGYKEAMKILDEGITPLQHSTAGLREKTFSEFAAWARTLYNDQPQTARRTVMGKAKEIIDRALKLGDSATAQEMNKYFSETPVSKKINIFDYFRTPTKVLEKIGLKQEADALRAGYESYMTDLPNEIEKITAWSQRVPEESNSRIFNWLDGIKINLNPDELKVASEIKQYLSTWADKLGLKKNERISDYITHIWEKGNLQHEFDEDLAKLIDPKIAKSVYDPFLLHRTGGRIDYIKDTWRALDAYTKRAVRRYSMSPALEKLQSKEAELELSQWKYVKNQVDKINMRPTEFDNLIDNFIKSTPLQYTFGQRPVATLTRNIRQAVHRGALGLNVSSAIRNLSQAANTYAELGERWTSKGYLDLVRNWSTGELERTGVLRDSFIQDRTISAIKKTMDSVDKGLFFLFEKAEKINRGAAYFGAKAKALTEGKNLDEAVKYATDVVRKTQFSFGPLDTPVFLQSDAMKLLLQFQSFNVKQAEFLVDKVSEKDVAGILRYVGATLALSAFFNKAFGINLSLLPINLSSSPFVQMGTGAVQAATGVLQGDETVRDAGIKAMDKAKWTFFPAGVQGKKTYEGVKSYLQGASTTPAGNVRFPIPQDAGTAVKSALFGQYATGQDYFDQDQRALSPQQSETFKAMKQSGVDPTDYYNEIQQARDEAKQLKDALATYQQTGTLPATTGASTQTQLSPSSEFSLSGTLQTSAKQTADRATVRQLLQSGIPEDKAEAIASGRGINYEATKLAIIQDLPVVDRTAYVIQQLGSTKDFATTFNQLVNQKILTTSIVDQMEELGKVTDAQAKALKAQINVAKGKSPVARATKSISVRKPTVSYKKPKTIKIKVPKLKLAKAKTIKLKPIKVNMKKIRTQFPRKLRLA